MIFDNHSGHEPDAHRHGAVRGHMPGHSRHRPHRPQARNVRGGGGRHHGLRYREDVRRTRVGCSLILHIWNVIHPNSRDRQALIKGDFNDGRVPTHIKRKKTMKRIQEWEKFEESCHMLKEMDDDTIVKISELQRERRVRADSLGALKDVRVHKNSSNLRKAKSVSNSHQLSPQ